MSEYTSEEILEAITDPDGKSNAQLDLLTLLTENDIPIEPEIYDELLSDIVEKGLLTEQNYQQIYSLIPPGSVYSYTVTTDPDKETEKKSQTVTYLNTPNKDPRTIERAVSAIIASALGKEVIYEMESGYVQGVNSNYDFYANYDAIQPDFYISNTISITEPVGFFSKLFPDDEHLKYDFNTNDENMYCVLSALFKQEPKLYQQCNLLPPTPKEERKFYLEILNKCNIATHDEFAITPEKVAEVYRSLGQAYQLNVNITQYYLTGKSWYFKPDQLPRRTLKLNFDTSKELLKLSVAKVDNHMFNINKTTSSRKDALLYLANKVAFRYEELKDKRVSDKIKDIRKLSREHAKDYKQYHENLLNNPDELLKNIDVNSCVSLETEEDDLGTDKDKVVYVPFIFDFETVLNENNEHCIYSYVIKKVSVVGGATPCESYFDYFPFEQKTKMSENVLIKLFNFVIANTKDGERAILFAHNGAKFDNLLILKMASITPCMHSFREVTAGPNNDIMLSLDITYSYKLERHSTKYYKKVISFRDSYKLLDCRAADIPRNYGTKAFKLPYCYNLYNEMFKITQNKTLTKAQMKYKMLRYFQRESDNMFSLKNGNRDTEMTETYKQIYNNTFDSNDETINRELKQYVDVVKKKKIYYSPELYCILYNKYDVLVVEEGLLKMQEYIRSLHSVESICSLIDKGSAVYGDDSDRLVRLKKKVIETTQGLSAVKDLNIFSYRSLASLVFDIAKRSGIFDNIYKLSGNLKKFIQLSVVGGRVMKNPLKENHKYESKHYEYFLQQVGKESTPELDKEILERALEDSIIDNDAVSLYPSAISLCQMPAGKPSIYNIEDKDQQLVLDNLHNFLKKGRSFFCLDIETQKDLEFPILSEKDENGIRRFRNGKFHKLVLGDIALSDAIKYQNAKVTKIYTMVRFEKTCDRFAQFIKTLFTLRLIFKAIKLPCQNTIKLMMNSSYGRTILKQSHYKKVYKSILSETDREKFKNYLSKNYFYLKPELIRMGNFVKLHKRELKDNPEGYPHVGSHILEMSKTLMNRMFSKIYDNGLSVYYTDTDSIHVKAESLTKISDMLGEDMTQFHSDFGEDGYRGTQSAGMTAVGIFAIKSLFVMKKCYYDKLFCINNKTNKYELIEHKRVKGITSEFMTEKRYEQLIDGDVLECDLCDYRDMVLRKTKEGSLVSLSSFKRAISQTD